MYRPAPRRSYMGSIVLALVCVTGGWTSQVNPPSSQELAKALIQAETEEEKERLLSTVQREQDLADLYRALLDEGQRARSQRGFSLALDAFRVASTVASKLDDLRGVARAQREIGSVHRMQGNTSQAMTEYRLSAILARTSGDSAGVAESLLSIGVVYFEQKQYEMALEYFSQSLALSETLGDQDMVAAVSYNIAGVHQSQGDYSRALEFFTKSLSAYQELDYPSEVASRLTEIGHIHKRLGNYDKALESYRKSLAIFEKLGDQRGLSSALNDISGIESLLGYHEQALEKSEQSASLKQTVDDEAGKVVVTLNLASDHYVRGDFAKAKELYRKALGRARELEEPRLIVEALHGTAVVLSDQGDYASALAKLHESLKLSESLNNPVATAEIQHSMARVHDLAGDYSQALELAEKAAGAARRMGLSELLWQSLTIAGKGYGAAGRLEEGFLALGEAIVVVESLRTHVTGDERTEQRFFAKRVFPYQAMVWLMVGGNQPDVALLFAERAKARVLLDVLQKGRPNITKVMSPQEIQQEARLTAAIASLNSKLYIEMSSSPPDAVRTAEAQSSLQKARADLASFRADLYIAHPGLKVRRGEIDALTFQQTNELLPDDRTAVLEYVVEKGVVYLFVVTKDDRGTEPNIKVYELPEERTKLAERVERFRRQLALRDLSFQSPASDLYEILVAPAAGELNGKDKLVIVPDAELWGLPFEALWVGGDHYLIDDAAITYAPSLTTLREMVRLKNRREGASSRSLLALGNPALTRSTLELLRGVDRESKLRPLPEAEIEVKEIARLYGADQSTVYVGPEAREDHLKKEASRYRIIHLATHGLFDDARPMFSYLLLSQSAGGPREDGILEAWEMMDLDLSADMTVLSACSTARGTVGAGEGLIGMTWALFVAGSPALVASRWDVDSVSTTTLMVEFHRSLVRGTNTDSPLSKAEALRAASLKLRRDDRYRHPFYWAAFAVMGDGF